MKQKEIEERAERFAQILEREFERGGLTRESYKEGLKEIQIWKKEKHNVKEA